MIAAIWIDRENAKLIKFSENGIEKEQLKLKAPNLYEEVVHHLGPADRIVILGPGVAKFNFKTLLDEHHPSISRRVVACQTMEQPSDHQIADCAAKLLRA